MTNKELAYKKARRFAFIISICLVCLFTIVCFLPEKTIAINGSSGYSAIYKAESTNKVALMFNVYENTDVVNGILDLLKNNDVKCTFFVGGCWADDNKECLQKIVDGGHQIGNHGYYHKEHNKLTEKENYNEIFANHTLIKSYLNITMDLFAPPSGAFNNTTLKVASNLNYKTIMWSVDTIDWRDKDENKVITRAKKASGGDFVLMHPKEWTLKALPTILKDYKDRGLQAVTVGECLQKDDI